MSIKDKPTGRTVPLKLLGIPLVKTPIEEGTMQWNKEREVGDSLVHKSVVYNKTKL